MLLEVRQGSMQLLSTVTSVAGKHIACHTLTVNAHWKRLVRSHIFFDSSVQDHVRKGVTRRTKRTDVVGAPLVGQSACDQQFHGAKLRHPCAAVRPSITTDQTKRAARRQPFPCCLQLELLAGLSEGTEDDQEVTNSRRAVAVDVRWTVACAREHASAIL